MPKLLSRKKDTRTPQQLLAELVRSAAACDPSRGIGDLAAATSRQLLELERPLNLLTQHPGGSVLAKRNNVNVTHDTLAALEASPAARAALVQLFSSALRLSDDSSAEAGGAPTSSQSHSSSSSSAVGPGGPSPPRPGGSTAGASSSTSSPAASARPTGPSPQRLLGILTATAHLLIKYLEAATTLQKDAFGNECSLVQESTTTLLALLRCDALEGLSRLLAVERNRSAGARLLTGTHEGAIKELLLQVIRDAAGAICSEGDWESPLCLAAIRGLSHSHVLEQWAAHTLRRPASAAAAAGANGQDHIDMWTLELTFLECRDVGRYISNATAAAATVRQLLSGPCLQYCMAVQAVSQLHAVDGGPLYGLPYDALLPAVPTSAKKGQSRRLLSFAPLSCAVNMWCACLSQRPPVSLRPLRPRHLLALCLRTARAALGSLEQGSAGGEAVAAALGLMDQEQQQQQGDRKLVMQGKRQARRQREVQQRDGGGGTELAWVYGGGRGGLRQVLDPGRCPQLALSAMTLTTTLLPRRTCGNSYTGCNRSGQGRCEEWDVVPAGAATDPSGGASDSGNAEASPAACPAAAAVAGNASHARRQGAGCGAGRPLLDLLHDPAFAAEWWRLAVGTVRATLRYGERQQQQRAGVSRLAANECLKLLQAGLGVAEDAGDEGALLRARPPCRYDAPLRPARGGHLCEERRTAQFCNWFTWLG